MPSEWAVDSYQLSDRGRKRRHNEDYVGYFEPEQLKELATTGRLYLVADGVGGAASGEVASQYAVRRILYDFYNSREPDLETRLVYAIEDTNADIFERNSRHPEDREMATTLVAALIHHDRLLVANVGDSRAYLVRDQDIEQISQDHSFVEQLVREGAISADEAKEHPRRNRILRSLGIDERVKVDTFSRELFAGDIVVLCSDGLTRHVSDAEIAGTVTKYPSEKAVRRLVELANTRGGRDNISISVMRILPTPVDQTTTIRTQSLGPPSWDDLSPAAAERHLPAWSRRRWLIYVGAVFLLGVVIGLAILLAFVLWQSRLTSFPRMPAPPDTSETSLPGTQEPSVLQTDISVPESSAPSTSIAAATVAPGMSTPATIPESSATSPTSAVDELPLASSAPEPTAHDSSEVGPTNPAVLYDFVENASQATWLAGDGIYQVATASIDAELQIPSLGYVCVGQAPIAVDGSVIFEKALLTHPHQEMGFIQGTYPLTMPLQPGDVISATIGFPAFASTNDDGVTFEMTFTPTDGSGPPDLLFSQSVTFTDVQKSPVTGMWPLNNVQPGRTGTFTLEVKSGASSHFDWALWIDLRLLRP